VRFLHYVNGDSALHRMDTRFKLLCLVMISAACLRGGFVSLAVLSTGAALLILTAGRPRLFLPGPRFALPLAAVIVAVRSLTTAGDPLVAGLPVTTAGILQGLRLSWRLLLLMVYGSLLAGTTRTSEIQDAVRWLFRPLPFVNEGRVATMVGLAVRFVPLMLDQAGETAAAHRARCGHLRRNPLSRLSSVGMSLLRRSLLRAEDISMAMEARCYSETAAAEVDLRSSPRDWMYLAAVAALCTPLLFAGP